MSQPRANSLFLQPTSPSILVCTCSLHNSNQRMPIQWWLLSKMALKTHFSLQSSFLPNGRICLNLTIVLEMRSNMFSIDKSKKTNSETTLKGQVYWWEKLSSGTQIRSSRSLRKAQPLKNWKQMMCKSERRDKRKKNSQRNQRRERSVDHHMIMTMRLELVMCKIKTF